MGRYNGKMNRGFGIVGILVAVGVVVLAVGGGIFWADRSALSNITDYDSCTDARGSVIMESYPEQCRARDGRTFTRPLTPDEQDRINPPSNQFDVNALETGDVIAGMTVMEVRPYREDIDLPLSENVHVEFSGRVRLSGVIEKYGRTDFGLLDGRECFRGDEDSFARMPQMIGGPSALFFCFSNEESLLDKEGEYNATIEIDSYELNWYPSEIVSRGHVVDVLETEEQESTEPEAPLAQVSGDVRWSNTQNGWQPSGTPPACPSPLRLGTPTDLSLVTSILYPGQYRGGDYKPHGGFRFDNSVSGDVTVTAPMGAQIVDGERYLESGEVQYIFDFIAPCGIWYRFDHLRELSPKLAAIAETFPEAKEGDSRTYGLNSDVWVTEGEVIATAVGLAKGNNTFVDWGVYDLRSKNSASENSAWVAEHPNDQEQHAVCWFSLLSPGDEAIVRSLPPADGVSGATSDYCL